jgi:hypothetical protein
MKRNFENHIRKKCIQDDSIRYKDFHKATSLREKDAMPPHSVTIRHPSKSGKLNGADKIFLDLFYLNKYTVITTISFMIDDVETSWSFQTNGSKFFGVPYCLTLKLVSKLQATQMIIIIYNKDWHDRVTYQISLGIFSFSLLLDKKLRFSSNIYLLLLLLDDFCPGQSFFVQSQIKDLLKMEIRSTDHKEYIYVHASDSLFSQINKLVSNWDKVRKTKMKHAQKLWLDPYRETSKASLSTSCS